MSAAKRDSGAVAWPACAPETPPESASARPGRHKLTVTTPSDLEIVLTRTSDAPRGLVWEAMTRPEHVERWWGPRWITLTACEMDLRPGGAWRFVFRSPDGREHTFKGVYQEITPPVRTVQTFIYDVDLIRDHPALETMAFDERDEMTTLTITIHHDTKEAHDGHLNSGMEAGAGESYDRLAEYLKTLEETGGPRPAKSTPDRKLVLTRTFDAPRALVFKAWTDPEQVARWWGPHGFTNARCELDARPGGRIRVDIAGPDGTVHSMKGVFDEVIEPERIVFSAGAVEDEDGIPGLEGCTTVTFAEHDGRTTLTLEVVIVKATPETAWTFEGMESCWTQSLERLAAEVARAAAG
jgi:uncharacterized protein YndB with AHSA1/START domain